MARLVTALALAAVVSGIHLDSRGYPRYCGKDMATSKIRPVQDPRATSMELVHVQLLVRHGARTPYSWQKCWNGYSEAWNCSLRDRMAPVLHAPEAVPSNMTFDKIYTDGQNVFKGNCLLGQMLDEGYTQQQQNGAHFRAAYFGNGSSKLFQATEHIDLATSSDVYFESTDIHRTVGSGYIIVQNMFPNASSDAVPFHTGDLGLSALVPSADTCPAMNVAGGQWQASPEFHAWVTNKTNLALEANLSHYAPGYRNDILFDCLMTQRCTDRPLPNNMTDEFFLQMTSKLETSALLPYYYQDNLYARTAVAKLVVLMRNRLAAAMAGTGPRLYLSIVHDSTLNPLLAALGGPTYLTEWVPYASHVVLEVYRQPSTADHYFRLLYQGAPLPVPGCPTELCPAAAFFNLTTFATNTSICAVAPRAPASHQSVSASFSTTTLVAGITGGVVAGVAIGYLLTRTSVRKGYSADMSMAAIQPLSDARASSMALVQVQMMVRHGARTPFSSGQCWNGYAESWTCNIRDNTAPVLHSKAGVASSIVFDKIYTEGDNVFAGNCLLGQMVDEGYLQQKQNGENFRKAYTGKGPLALFQQGQPLDLTNTSDVFFESTDMQRTVNSGQVIVQNWFFDAPSSQPIPWHTNDLGTSYVTPNPAVCPALTAINSEWLASPEYKAWAKNATNVAWETELQTHITGYNHVTLFDCLMTQTCTDRPLPHGMTAELMLRSTTHEETTQLMQYLYKNNAYARTGMAAFVQRIRSRLQAAVAGQGPRLYLSAVHDTTLMPLLASLGGTAYLTEWVPYASHVAIELYYQASSKTHFFRLLYQGRPLPIANCTTELCPVNDFLAISAFATTPNICQKEQSFAPALVTAAPVDRAALTGSGPMQVAEGSGFSTTVLVLVGLGGILVGGVVGYAASARRIARAGYSEV
ncbi:hypothetical protein ACHHYP_04309 [Achlya hypogyna]|uniref:Histidine acid phosphatase n=1 Tax=Achlya hypogyna TaxID=1202772 RepID=A0A1V9Z1L0_ACHHY|nr:hypothetical protein ACHHYP_04309 [Achlya hypogyna]